MKIAHPASISIIVKMILLAKDRGGTLVPNPHSTAHTVSSFKGPIHCSVLSFQFEKEKI